MTHGAHPLAPAPHADIDQARHCADCRGWGTVITPDGRHELCPACQRPEETDSSAVRA
ncbi:hypothetical protein AB0D08_15795 [Kitasatospora sp. NPDC048540]|uniref:hypothetical protein n=1 Tax=unclassified Kitasatospora TaxID=2633591 RepID=UPI000A5E32C7|nr:hypothetical protein [Kitasatospora sp. MBT63]